MKVIIKYQFSWTGQVSYQHFRYCSCCSLRLSNGESRIHVKLNPDNKSPHLGFVKIPAAIAPPPNEIEGWKLEYRKIVSSSLYVPNFKSLSHQGVEISENPGEGLCCLDLSLMLKQFRIAEAISYYLEASFVIV